MVVLVSQIDILVHSLTHICSPGANSAVAVCLHNIAVEQIHLFRSGEGVGAGGYSVVVINALSLYNPGEALESVTDALEIAKGVS